VRAARTAYVAAAWLFAAGIVVQVFLIGMAAVAGRWSTAPHISLGHALALPLLAMVVLMFPSRLPAAVKGLTWLLLTTYVLQADVVIELRGDAPVLAAFHPVLALVDIVVVSELIRRTSRLPVPATPERASSDVPAAPPRTAS